MLLSFSAAVGIVEIFRENNITVAGWKKLNSLESLTDDYIKILQKKLRRKAKSKLAAKLAFNTL